MSALVESPEEELSKSFVAAAWRVRAEAKSRERAASNAAAKCASARSATARGAQSNWLSVWLLPIWSELSDALLALALVLLVLPRLRLLLELAWVLAEAPPVVDIGFPIAFTGCCCCC